MRITLSDVAREAGVSVVTVSRVINDTYREKVSDETRRKVLETVARLNYRPNVMARGLQKGRTYLIGIAIVRVADSFFGDILQGIHDAAAAADLGVLLGTRGLDIGKDESALRELQSRGVEGIIYHGTTHKPETAQKLVAEGLPLVQICNTHVDLNAPYVVVDHFRGAFMATEHLLRLGHRRIAHIGAYQGGDPQGKMRLAGYRSALQAHGMELDDSLIMSAGWNWESGYSAMKELYRHRSDVTAIFASSDFAAVGAMRACQDMGLRVPADMAVVGFDDLPFSAWLDVPLTTVAQPKEAMGQAAVKSLNALIEGDSAPNVMFEPQLIVRASCGS